MKENKIYTTEYYAKRNINFRSAAGLGFTQLVIFTPTGTGGYTFDTYIRNNKTGYCQNWFTGKRISKALWDKLYATTKPAF